MFDPHLFSEFLKHQVFIAFDTETTGMWAPINRVVEIGAVKFTLNLGEYDRFDQLVNPQKVIPEVVIEVHGITNEAVKNSPTIIPVMEDFKKFCEPGAILMAHNAPFDISFIVGELKRNDMTFADHLVLDTVEIARQFFPGLNSYSLLNLVKHFGMATSQDHRALSDARFVYYLFRKAAEKFFDIDSIEKIKATLTHYGINDDFNQDSTLPNEFDDLQFAIANSLRVEIDYMHPKHGSHTRVMVPKEVHRLGQTFYIIAHCELAGADRTFRLDRIGSYKVLAG